jgi:hypothetical protein
MTLVAGAALMRRVASQPSIPGSRKSIEDQVARGHRHAVLAIGDRDHLDPQPRQASDATTEGTLAGGTAMC